MPKYFTELGLGHCLAWTESEFVNHLSITLLLLMMLLITKPLDTVRDLLPVVLKATFYSIRSFVLENEIHIFAPPCNILCLFHFWFGNLKCFRPLSFYDYQVLDLFNFVNFSVKISNRIKWFSKAMSWTTVQIYEV